jgi:hypothetical protein
MSIETLLDTLLPGFSRSCHAFFHSISYESIPSFVLNPFHSRILGIHHIRLAKVV